MMWTRAQRSLRGVRGPVQSQPPHQKTPAQDPSRAPKLHSLPHFLPGQFSLCVVTCTGLTSPGQILGSRPLPGLRHTVVSRRHTRSGAHRWRGCRGSLAEAAPGFSLESYHFPV